MNESGNPVLAEQLGYHDVDIFDRVESADGRFKVDVVGVNRAERTVDFTSHGEHMVSSEKMFKMNARLMMSIGAKYFTENPTGQPRTASVRSVAPGCSSI